MTLGIRSVTVGGEVRVGSGRAWRRYALVGIVALAMASVPLSAFAASSSSVPVGKQPCSVASGDVNADGKPDLVVPNAGSNNVSVLLNSGTGTFTPASGSPFAVGAAPCSVAITLWIASGSMRMEPSTACSASWLLGGWRSTVIGAG